MIIQKLIECKIRKVKIVLSKDAALKSLITTSAIACDLYQNAEANIEVHKTQ
jgi:hypothetical protein